MNGEGSGSPAGDEYIHSGPRPRILISPQNVATEAGLLNDRRVQLLVRSFPVADSQRNVLKSFDRLRQLPAIAPATGPAPGRVPVRHKEAGDQDKKEIA
jgi:hypothetical protein